MCKPHTLKLSKCELAWLKKDGKQKIQCFSPTGLESRQTFTKMFTKAHIDYDLSYYSLQPILLQQHAKGIFNNRLSKNNGPERIIRSDLDKQCL